MFEMFFFPFGTEPYLAIKLFAKRKQLIGMVAKTGAERSKEYREKNEQGWKLIKLKYSVKTSKKRISVLPLIWNSKEKKQIGKESIGLGKLLKLNQRGMR